MKYLLFGNGNFIKYVASEFATSNVKAEIITEKEAIPVLEDEAIAVLAVSWKETISWIKDLHKKGYKQIYRVPIHMMQYDVRLFDAGKLCVEKLAVVSQEETELQYIETHIADRCNLKCKGCMHFSNLCEEDVYPDVEQFTKDFKRIKELFGNVFIIRLMGGEPLLNPNATTYFDIVREIFPVSEIRIVTNGLLVPQQTNTFWKNVQKNQISVDVSPYPPTIKMIDSIKATLDSYGIPYGTISTELERFRKSLTLEPKNNPEESVKLCQSSHCRFLRNGKIAKCPLPILIPDFNAYFGTNIVSQDVFDIYKETSGSELKRKLDNFADMCKYCPCEASFIDWEPTIHNAKINDWVVE